MGENPLDIVLRLKPDLQAGMAQAQAQFNAGMATLNQSTKPVEAAMQRLTLSLSGAKLVQDATNIAKAVDKIGGASMLTEQQLKRFGATAQQAVEKLQLIGQKVPADIQRLADAAKHASGELEHMGKAGEGIREIGKHILETAAGFISAEAIIEGFKEVVHLAAETLKEITLQGSHAADIEQAFDHLTTGVGLLGEHVLPLLRDGVHGTITDLDLMTRVNQNLAAGLNLTEAQMATLAKGSFALAKATGIDTAQAFDKLSDAMVTGRTRQVAILTGKIDAEEAEKKFAASLGSTEEHLNAEGKMEALRQAILEKVEGATERLGETTIRLADKVAQAQVAYKNFMEELGTAVAVSPVIEAAFTGIEEALAAAFGGTQEEAIKTVMGLINDAAIALIGLAQTGVTAAGFLVKEWYAVEKVFLEVIHIVDDIHSAILGVQLASAMGMLPGSSADLVRAVEIQKQLDALTEKTKRLREESAHITLAQSGVDPSIPIIVNALEDVKQRMIAAKDALPATAFVGPLREGALAATDFVGPLEAVAQAEARAGAAANEHGKFLTQSKAEIAEAARKLKEYNEALDRYNSVDGPAYLSILNKIGNELYEGIAFDHARGQSTADLAKIYHTTSTVIEQIIKSEEKYKQQQVEIGVLHKAESAGLSGLVKNWNELGTAVKGQQAEFEAFGKAQAHLDDVIAKSTMLTTDYQIFKIHEWEKAQIDALDKSLEGWQQHAAVVHETAVREANDVRYSGESVIAMLARIAAEQDRSVAKSGEASSAFADLARSIEQIANIGGEGFLGGFMKAIGIGASAVGNLTSALHQLRKAQDEGASGWAQFAAGANVALTIVGVMISYIQHLREEEDKAFAAGQRMFQATAVQLEFLTKTIISPALREALQQTADDMRNVLGPSAHISMIDVQSLHLKEIIDELGGIAAVLRGDNAEAFVLTQQFNALFTMIETHGPFAAQAIKQVDTVLAAMGQSAIDSGTVVPMLFNEMIDRARAAGVVLTDVNKLLKDMGNTGLENLQAVFAGVVDEDRIDAVAKRIVDAQKAMDDANKAILADKGGPTAEHKAAGEAAQAELAAALRDRTQAAAEYGDKLKDLGTIAVGAFAAAYAAGDSLAEAINKAHPGLERLRKDYEALGLTVEDAGTRMLLFLDANKKQVDALSALGNIIRADANLNLLDPKAFAAMQRQGNNMINDVFNKGMSGGLSADESTRAALLAGQEYLHAAEEAAKKTGQALDADTAQKIQQSKDLGIWQDAARKDTDRLLDKLDDILHVLQGLPVAIHDATPGSSDSRTAPPAIPGQPSSGETGTLVPPPGSVGSTSTGFLPGEPAPGSYHPAPSIAPMHGGPSIPPWILTDGGFIPNPNYPGPGGTVPPWQIPGGPSPRKPWDERYEPSPTPSSTTSGQVTVTVNVGGITMTGADAKDGERVVDIIDRNIADKGRLFRTVTTVAKRAASELAS